MKRVLLVDSGFPSLGGGTAVTAWMLQALKDEHDVSVLTGEPLSVEALNRFHGTFLNASDVKTLSVPRPVRWLLALDPDPYSIQRTCLLMRLVKVVQDHYDVLIGHGEVDLGRRAIQYIHYPWFHRLYRQLYPDAPPLNLRDCLRVRARRCRPWRLLSGYSFERMKANLTLVNSRWTGARVREFYGIEALTVYPPVRHDFPSVPWAQREDGFVCLGRISPEKRFGQIIQIVAAVRAQGHDVHLHIVGTRPHGRYGDPYCAAVRQAVQENSSWIQFHEEVPRPELVRLLASHRYGIHCLPDEPFGIAVAEMVSAGCLPFVPHSGGPLEIVGPEERLLFDSSEEAMRKITVVLDSPADQEALRAYLHDREALFSTERFMEQMRQIVQDFPAG